MVKNFIRPLPDEEDAAVDESLLMLQIRVRKNSEWGRLLKNFIKDQGMGRTQK